VARLVGSKVPVSICTPTIAKMPGNPERTRVYLESLYRKWQFAIPGESVKTLLESRANTLMEELGAQIRSEPATAKRKLK